MVDCSIEELQKCICHPDNHSIRPIPIISLWVGYLLNGCCHCRYWAYTSGQCDLGFVHGQNISERRRDFKQRETRRETCGNHMYIFFNCLYLINKEKWLLKYFLNVCTPCELSPNALILFFFIVIHLFNRRLGSFSSNGHYFPSRILLPNIFPSSYFHNVLELSTQL